MKKYSRKSAIAKRKPAASAFQQAANENIAPSRYRCNIWMVTGVAERDIPRFDREQAMAKARQLVENDPFVAGLVQTYVDNVVGGLGFRLAMTTKDTGWNKEFESAWEENKDSLDIRGVRTWGKIMRCWQYRKCVDGDIGVYHNIVDVDSDEFFIQNVEADRIRCKKFDYLDQGIEFNEDGRPLRYWIGPRPKDQQDIPAQLAEGTPIDASDFCLLAHYPTDRAEMLRGVTMLLPMFNHIQDIREILNAMLQKVKASAFLAFKNTLQPSALASPFGDTESIKKNEDGKTRRTRALVPMGIADLIEGENIEELESKNPNTQFENFLRMTIRYAGSAMGMPLEFLLFDVGALNYSSMRAVREMAKRRFQCEQEALKLPARKVVRSWGAYMVERKKLKPPKSLKGQEFSHRWTTPIWPSLDPQKDVQAYGLALGYGLTTIHDILAETSERTFAELVAIRKEEVADLEEAKIPVNLGMPGQKTSGKPEDEISAAEGLAPAAKGEV